MAGNVCEWCADWYHETRDLRVGRGGSWDDYQEFLLVSYRAKDVASFRDSNIGFRLVQDIP